jgi:hypothetical protein
MSATLSARSAPALRNTRSASAPGGRAELSASSNTEAPRAALPLPPFRLRLLLLIGLGAWLLAQSYPRLQAAFALHDLATSLANYALCMAGPTGPSALRDRPIELERLIRRRLIAASGSEQPFAPCAKLARAITGSVESERAHQQSASEFREYGGTALSLPALAVSAAPLKALAARAWPFAQGGYVKLIKPSLGAVEAPHLPAPARPALGSGLPPKAAAYRNVWHEAGEFGLALGAGSELMLYGTRDGGKTFVPLSRRQELIERHAERCQARGASRSYRISPHEDGRLQQALFIDELGRTSLGTLAPISERVLASGCDARSLIVLTRDPERLRLRACPFAGRCGELALPPLIARALPDTEVDLAKVKGVVVLSAARAGVVRVVSSRDDGRSFTPPVVAFDAAEYPELASARPPPARLLSLGDRLLLYAGSERASDAYPVLVSDDQGVSFRAP